MRSAIWVVCFAMALPAVAQEPASRQLNFEQMDREARFRSAIFRRAREIAPARRDAPLRELNLTDNEVREIQEATRSFLPPPNTYLNISPVVVGCPCEEGPACSDQVYVLAESSVNDRGLQLSRVRDEWKVGSVQKWWLEYVRLVEKRPSMSWLEYDSAAFTLAREFPVCAASDSTSKVAATPRPGESAR